jgi:hypothetical protein
MRFTLPDGRQFEICDDWWTEAGMDGFERHGDISYRGGINLR